MEIHQLRYVLAVAETGSFSRAAERCHVAQPSLSQQIQKLEDELGQRLFERLKRGVKLTAAGESLTRRAGRIFDELDAARREAQDARALMAGSVAVGALPTIAPYLLPEVIRRFATQYPGLEVVVHEDTTENLLRLIVAREIDLVIASLPITDSRFEIQPLFSEELLLATPPGHRLATQPSVRITDLRTERFILMKEGHCLGDQVLDFCDRTKIRPRVNCRSGQMETVQALVAAGLGVSLIPNMATQAGPQARPVYRSLQPPKPKRAIAALWARKRSPGRGAREFLRCLREVTDAQNRRSAKQMASDG